MKPRVFLITLLATTLLGWAEPALAQRKAKMDREFHLRVGREMLVKDAGLKVTFKSVGEDSRCPEGVDCVWAGNAKVVLVVRKGRRKAVEVELNTMSEPTSAIYQGYEIKLVRLGPYPRKDVQIKKRDYVATLIVAKK